MTNITRLALLSLMVAAPAGATDLQGLIQNLTANQDLYQHTETLMRSRGLIPRNDPGVAADIAALGAARPVPQAPAAQPPAPRPALGEAQALAGHPVSEVPGIAKDNVAEFDPQTGQRVEKTEGDMYTAIVDAISGATCKTATACGALKSLLWGAVVLNTMQREGHTPPEMKVDETKLTWQRWVTAVEKGRAEYLKDGRVSGDVAQGLPTIDFQTEEQLGGATATWDGNIHVGKQFAGLGGAGKNAVLFHEYLHDSDSHSHQGLNDNFWSARLPEPDETPSGKNWTETLAYRQMGDWADVLNLPWPKSLNN